GCKIGLSLFCPPCCTAQAWIGQTCIERDNQCIRVIVGPISGSDETVILEQFDNARRALDKQPFIFGMMGFKKISPIFLVFQERLWYTEIAFCLCKSFHPCLRPRV